MIADQQVQFSGTRTVTDSGTLANYSNVLDIPKKKAIDKAAVYVIVDIIESNALGVYLHTKLFLIRDDSGNAKAYYLNVPEVSVLISTADTNYIKVYAKASNLFSLIRVVVEYVNGSGYLIPRFGLFDTTAGSITNLVAIGYNLGGNTIKNMDGEAAAKAFVSQITPVLYEYTILVNSYTDQSGTPDPTLFVGWTVTYKPVFFSGSFTQAIQTWEVITNVSGNPVYFKYVRRLGTSGGWGAFIKVHPTT